jgi:hypothetical protein
MKKFLIAAATLTMAAAPIAASAQPFGGHGFGGRPAYAHGYYRGGNGGAAVAAGLFGLVLGAAIADSQPAYGYPPPYAVQCDWETRAYPGPWGTVHYEQVQVCR